MTQENRIKNLEKQNKELRNQVKNLTEMVNYLTKKRFGRSSEKTRNELDGQVSLFNEEEPDSDDEPEPEKVEVRKYTRRSKGQKEKLIKDLPVEIVEYKLDGEDLKCPWCGTLMQPIGKENVRQEIEVIPAKVIVKQYVRYSYSCPQCAKDGESTIIKAPMPEPLIKRSLASASAVSHVIYEKYVNAVPLYRQEKEWHRYGVDLSRTTLANWIIKCAQEWLKPVTDKLRELLLNRDILHADETPIQVLNEPGKKATTQSYVWLYRSGNDGKPPIVLFEYRPSRSGDNAVKYLDGFNGYLHTDGYKGYEKLKNITRCGCWAHLRRYFIDAIPSNIKPSKEITNAEKGHNYCNKLFEIEKTLKNMDCDKRKAERVKQEKPVLDAFWCWLETLNPLRGSKLGKAVQYAINQKSYMENYLLDGRCSISNNIAENSIRPFTVGRKNWLFSASTKGAEASAIIYSLIETAKANSLDAYNYIEFLLNAMSHLGKDPSPESMAEVMPWSDIAIENCRYKRNE